jgi:hypothetical protein
MAPKHKGDEASNSYMPKRIQNVLPLSEKVKILDNNKRKKNHMPKLLRHM